MSKIWHGMLLISLSFLILFAPDMLLGSLFLASNKAIKLSFDMAGMYIVWLGFLQILEDTGLNKKIAKALSPVIKKIFGQNISEAATTFIALNMSANLMGLGNAATPFGIKAMQELDEKNGKITTAMVLFLIINCTSLQLIPTTVISVRQLNGSVAANDIILPTLLCSLICSVTGVFLVKLINKFKRKKV